MNYGKIGIENKKHQMNSMGTKIFKSVFSVLMVLVIIAVGFAGLMGVRKVTDYVEGVLDELPALNVADVTPNGYISTVVDSKGNVTAELLESGSNRVYVTLDQVPVDMQHAFIAIEDERFYEHNGVDLKGIVRAGLKGIASGGNFAQGASTITQQLLKNNVFDGWTNETKEERVKRKIQEQFLAIALEKKVSKEWILENYLNTINLGQNTLGVQSAALRYFNKSVEELTLSEAACIAAVTKNPSAYNPLTHPEENNTRRELVLDSMVRLEYITEEQKDAAMADDIYARISDANVVILEESSENITSYFVDALTYQVMADLQSELGYTEAQAYNAVYSGGLTIYSTQDPDIQAIVDDEINDSSNYDINTEVSFSYELTIQLPDGSTENYSSGHLLRYFRDIEGESYDLNYKNEEAAQAAIDEFKTHLLEETGGIELAERVNFTLQPQASMTVIEQESGNVVAMSGGRGPKTGNLTLNRATDDPRQPGSTFKILAAYAPALESGEYNLGTVIVDEPWNYTNGRPIKNSSGSYKGSVSMTTAITNSINVCAVKTIQTMTPKVGLAMVQKFGISTMVPEDEVESLALGGVTVGVKNEELAAAYAAIANGGVYQAPSLYTKIIDHDGNLLLERNPETHRVIKETTAFFLTNAMENVLIHGTGTACRFDGQPQAGKTGTTSSNRDSWFAGYTPYYTCAVWGGYDDHAKLGSTRFTKNLWRATMSRIHEDLDRGEFVVPDGLVKISVCSVSGLLATHECTSTMTEYFDKDNAPTKYCSSHVTATICTESGKLATDFCPEECVETKSFLKESWDSDQMAPEEYCDIHTAPKIPEIPTDENGNPIINGDSSNQNGAQNGGGGNGGAAPPAAQ